ncbi:hypothetical protein [Mucilaginibacter sp.]
MKQRDQFRIFPPAFNIIIRKGDNTYIISSIFIRLAPTASAATQI